MGAYISVPTWWRSLGQRYRLELGECRACGALNFPTDGACSSCGRVSEFDVVEPTGEGEIVARTVITGGVPPEFDEYLEQVGAIGVVVVELDEGVRVPGMLTDCDPSEPTHGDRVEAVVRRVYTQENIRRYGYKFRPIENRA
jgi:hydroxymethylglutaryl-CoA synthase